MSHVSRLTSNCPKSMNETLIKLAPFLLRARKIATGRENLKKKAKSLAFLLVTTDLSENSLNQAKRDYQCPIYTIGTMETMKELFGFENTKIAGVFRSSLADSIEPTLKGQ